MSRLVVGALDRHSTVCSLSRDAAPYMTEARQSVVAQWGNPSRSANAGHSLPGCAVSPSRLLAPMADEPEVKKTLARLRP